MQRIFFGGSFNPVHRAHLICSGWAGMSLGFDVVALVPAGQPNLKNADYPLANSAQRLAMLRRAIADFDRGEVRAWYAALPAGRAQQFNWPDNPVRFEIEPIELEHDRVSYTIDTARALRQRGERDIHWLIGADQLLSLHRWHRFEELMKTVEFHVMHRPGYQVDWLALHPLVRALRDRLVEVPQLSISATEIRRRIVERRPLEDLLTPGVSEYIAANRLYV